MSFSEILDLYGVKKSNVIFQHVDSSLLKPLAESIEKLHLEIQNYYNNDEHLLEFYSVLRRAFFKVISSFLPFNAVIHKELEQQILKECVGVKNSYPSLFSKTVKPIIQSLIAVKESNENPLKNSLCNYINETTHIGERIAIVTKKAIPLEEKAILSNTFRDIFKKAYYTENSFRQDRSTFDRIIYIGNPSYFGEFVTNTFRGKEIIFVSYDLFHNSITPKKIFRNINEQGSYSTIFRNVTIGEPLQKKSQLNIEQKEEVSHLVDKFMQTQENIDTHVHEFVYASILFLENNRFLFAPKDSRIRTFNPNNTVQFIEQVGLQDIVEDDYIIIRNERDTGLIAEVADDYILKKNAKEYREMQQGWKQKLRKQVGTKGITRVSEILMKRYKVRTASSVSVRNWCNEESICPTELDKILKAFKYTNEETNMVCRAMKEIQVAHRQAGRIISNKLMSELSINILRELQENGYYTFESKEFDGASFNIERVVSIDSSEYLIAPSNLMKPINIE